MLRRTLLSTLAVFAVSASAAHAGTLYDHRTQHDHLPGDPGRGQLPHGQLGQRRCLRRTTYRRSTTTTTSRPGRAASTTCSAATLPERRARTRRYIVHLGDGNDLARVQQRPRRGPQRPVLRRGRRRQPRRATAAPTCSTAAPATTSWSPTTTTPVGRRRRRRSRHRLAADRQPRPAATGRSRPSFDGVANDGYRRRGDNYAARPREPGGRQHRAVDQLRRQRRPERRATAQRVGRHGRRARRRRSASTAPTATTSSTAAPATTRSTAAATTTAIDRWTRARLPLRRGLGERLLHLRRRQRHDRRPRRRRGTAQLRRRVPTWRSSTRSTSSRWTRARCARPWIARRWPVPRAQPKPSLRSSRLSVSKNRIAVKLSCPKGGATCRGKLTLRTATKVKLGAQARAW